MPTWVFTQHSATLILDPPSAKEASDNDLAPPRLHQLSARQLRFFVVWTPPANGLKAPDHGQHLRWSTLCVALCLAGLHGCRICVAVRIQAVHRAEQSSEIATSRLGENALKPLLSCSQGMKINQRAGNATAQSCFWPHSRPCSRDV